VRLLGRGASPEQVIVNHRSMEVAAVNLADNKELWRYKSGPLAERHRAACRIGSQIFLGAYNGHLAALDAATGELHWEEALVDLPRDAAIEVTQVGRDVLFVGPRLLACVSTAGKVLWRCRYDQDYRVVATARVNRGLLLAVTRRQKSEKQTQLETIDLSSGRRTFRADVDPLGGRLNMLPTEHGVLIFDGRSARLYRPAKK
jgi:outer membrane protein assembly factor BamB